MPAPHIPLPPTLGPKHLYRHLLREVSYLPPLIRPFFAFSVRDRFRKHRPRDKLTDQHRKTGLRVLRKLRAANSGNRASMGDVILRGLGRIGWRRMILFRALKTIEGLDNAGDIENLLKAAERGEGNPQEGKQKTQREAKTEDRRAQKRDLLPVANPAIRLANSWLAKWNLPKLKKYIESQIKQHGKTKALTGWPGSPGKTSDDMINIPELNIWGKPLHPGRIETRRRIWWKRQAAKVMPPLQPAEFETLGRVSDGAQEVEEHLMTPSRRPLARQLKEDVQEGLEWDLEAHATQSATAAERPKMFHQSRSGRASQGPYTKSPDNNDCSDRFFRRQYQRAFLLSSKMEQNPNTLEDSITWGSIESKAALPTKEQLAIFENLPDMSTKKKKKNSP